MLTAPEDSMLSRVTPVTLGPIGAMPRMRLPVTTISSGFSPLSGAVPACACASARAGSAASHSAAACASGFIDRVGRCGFGVRFIVCLRRFVLWGWSSGCVNRAAGPRQGMG